MRHSRYPPDWKKRRRTVFRRDDFMCLNCGYTSPVEHDKDRGLHCHHKKKVSDGGGHGFDNLATVCQECHIEIHSNKGIGELDRSRFHECAYDGCDEIRGEHALHNGGYCNTQCEYRDKAETAVEAALEETTLCAVCFSNWPPGRDTCPNCDNWDREKTVAPTDFHVDTDNLAAHIIRQADRLDLFREPT